MNLSQQSSHILSTSKIDSWVPNPHPSHIHINSDGNRSLTNLFKIYFGLKSPLNYRWPLVLIISPDKNILIGILLLVVVGLLYFYGGYTNLFMELTERGLLKVSLVGTIVGLVALYFVVGTLVVESRNIGDVASSSIGSSVSVNGTISGMRTSDGNMFFTLDDGTGKIKVVLWKNVLDRLVLKGFDLEKIKDGEKVMVEGSVEGYKGEMEIIGKEIKIIA